MNKAILSAGRCRSINAIVVVGLLAAIMGNIGAGILLILFAQFLPRVRVQWEV